ncbi:molybdate ABC transporter substrate-binding protein [Lentibacillus halophilus]|uniref:Molybdate ABC transporter substrate-binding protein n=1 Tax=Lentibacillus halophilus TaxID=295065 RepID=A0ABN0Z6B6_9BACI
MKYVKWLMIAFVAVLAACSSDGDNSDEEKENVALTISAAASMTDAMKELKDVYEQKENVALTLNFAGSGKLAQQIRQGAPADVFISANQDWMDRLEKNNRIIQETRKDVTGNSIVLIAGENSDLDYQSMDAIEPDDVDQIAIGNPESVPAGKYADQTLRSLDIRSKLEKELVFAKDVRQVLTYVETGNTDIGFVYKSDALISDKIQVLTKAAAETHDAIIYPAAVTADTENKKAAKSFVQFLQSDDAQSVFEEYGFDMQDG